MFERDWKRERERERWKGGATAVSKNTKTEEKNFNCKVVTEKY